MQSGTQRPPYFLFFALLLFSEKISEKVPKLAISSKVTFYTTMKLFNFFIAKLAPYGENGFFRDLAKNLTFGATFFIFVIPDGENSCLRSFVSEFP